MVGLYQVFLQCCMSFCLWQQQHQTAGQCCSIVAESQVTPHTNEGLCGGWVPHTHVCSEEAVVSPRACTTGTYVPVVSFDAHAHLIVFWMMWVYSRMQACMAAMLPQLVGASSYATQAYAPVVLQVQVSHNSFTCYALLILSKLHCCCILSDTSNESH